MKHFKKIFLALVILLGVGLASCKKDTTLADAKKELEITYTEGQDITLPAKVGDVVITWSSDKPAVISNAGKVVQGTEDVVVKITATLTYKGKTDTKEFTITVKKGIVAGAAKAALLEHYKDTLASTTYKVETDVELIATVGGVSVTWESDNVEYFTNDGKVTIPTYRQGNQSVSLKATLGDGDTHTFRFNLVAKEATTEDLIEEQLDLVAVKPAGEYQETDFVVMTEVEIEGVKVPVTWTTSDAEAMTADGKLVVFYEPAEKTVTLTASITYKEITLTRDVVFKVKSALKYNTFYAALVPANKEQKVMITGVSYFTNLDKSGFYMIDKDGKLGYFYGTKPTNVVEGKLYDVIATADAYYNTTQFTSFSFTEVAGEVNIVAPEEMTFDEIVGADKPSSTKWNQHSIITLKNVRVRMLAEDSDYNTFLVPVDLAADATLNDKNSIMIYYQSNINAVRALNGKVIDEIQLVNNGYRTNNQVWNFNFLGTADDIKVTLTPEEILTNVKNALSASIKNAYYKAQTITLPTESQGATIEWASTHSASIDPATGVVTMPEGEAVEVTLTASITVPGEPAATGSVSMKTMVGPLVAMSIQDFKAKDDGYIGMIQGVVTAVSGVSSSKNIYLIEDAESGIAINTDEALVIGKQVTIVGTKVKASNGLIQIIKASDVEIVSVDGTIPAPVVLDETVALTAEGLLPYQSRRLSIDGFTITKIDVDKYGTKTLTLKRGDETVNLRWDNRVLLTPAAKTHLDSLVVDQKINLVGAPLGWHNGPQFAYDHESQIYVVALTDPTEQANFVLSGISVPAIITTADKLTLPTTGQYEAVITWTSSHPDIIATDGTVTLPTENTTVTLDVTVTVGEDVVSKTFDVRVKVVEGIEIIEIYDLEENAAIDVTGVVIATEETTYNDTTYLNIFLQDDTAAIYVFRPKTHTAKVGDKVKVVGKVGEFRGLVQVAADSAITIISSDHELPDPAVLTTVAELVENKQSQRININDLVVKSISGRSLVLTDGTGDVDVRGPESGAVYDYVQTANVGQHVNVKGMILGWFNAPQFNLSSMEELELLTFTDEHKVIADMNRISIPERIGASGVALAPSGVNGSTITWVSSNTAIIGNDGKIVTQPEEDTDVTLTATFVLGDVTKTKVYEVTIAKPSTAVPETFTETFDASSATGSYADGSFTGVNGVVWTYVHARDEEATPIDGTGIMLRRAAESSSLSATFTNGIGEFSFEYRKAFTGAAARKYAVDVTHNGTTTTYDLPEFGSGSGAQETIYEFTQALNLTGTVTIKIYATGTAQAVFDNFKWTTMPE